METRLGWEIRHAWGNRLDGLARKEGWVFTVCIALDVICFLIFLSMLLVLALPFLDGGETWLWGRRPCTSVIFPLFFSFSLREADKRLCFETYGCGISLQGMRTELLKRRAFIYSQTSTLCCILILSYFLTAKMSTLFFGCRGCKCFLSSHIDEGLASFR